MHVVQSAVLLSYVVHPSVCLSVRLSVTLMYREHIGWTSSKLITRIISLGSSLLGATTSAIENSGGIGVGRSSPETCNISETEQDRTKVLLMTNRKLHTRFRLVSISTSWMTSKGHYAQSSKTRAYFRAHHEKLNEDRLYTVSDDDVAQ